MARSASFKPRGDRPNYNRDDRAPRRDRDDARPAGRSSDRKFGDRKPYASRDRDGEKRPYTPRGERSYGDRPSRDGDRPERKFGGERKFSRGGDRDRGAIVIVARARISVIVRRAANPSRGKSGRAAPIAPSVARVRSATARASSTGRATIAVATSGRFSRSRDDRGRATVRSSAGRAGRIMMKAAIAVASGRKGARDWQEHPRSEGQLWRSSAPR